MSLLVLAKLLLTMFVLSTYSGSLKKSGSYSKSVQKNVIFNKTLTLYERSHSLSEGSPAVGRTMTNSLIQRPPIETPGPFSPRYQIGKFEMSDTEWADEIKEAFSSAGLVPGILPDFPKGLVNINYGPHACVHMGSFLKASTTAFMPSRVSYPSDPEQLYTLVFMDITDNMLLWMVINIPGTSIINGQEVTQYQPPTPHSTNMFLSAALLQSSVINRRYSNIVKRSARLCEMDPRKGVHVKDLMEELGLETVVASNFFTVEYESYVNSIDHYCAKLY